MNKTLFKERYEALYPLPDAGWDTTWVDRLRSWDDFVENGATVAMQLRRLQACAGAYEKDFRSLAPMLHDLLMEAFTMTPEQQAELDEWKAELGFI